MGWRKLEHNHMRTNEILKQFPPESYSWAGKVTISLGYPTQGWVQLAITCTTYVQGAILACSNVFDPFPGLIRWLEAIAAGRLPAGCVIDEEGHEKTLRARSVNKDEFIFEICEQDDYAASSEETPLFMHVQVNRQQFISEFIKRWDDFLATQYDPAQWEEYGSNLRELDLTKLRAFVQGWGSI
jgi:hypothetical protein